MSGFTPEAAAAMDGPDWLSSRRRDAAEATVDAALPTAEAEIWRYSPIGKLDLGQYEPVDRPDSVTSCAVPAELAEAGVTVTTGADLTPEMVEGVGLGAAADSLTGLNDAFSAPVFIQVPADVQLDAVPLVITHRVVGSGAAGFPRVIVSVGPRARLRIVERDETSDPDTLVVPVAELLVGEGAEISHLVVQVLGRETWQIRTHVGALDVGATVSSSVLSLGGDYARARIDSRLMGENARSVVNALAFGTGEQKLDLRTVQDHIAPRTSSELLVKSVLDDRAQSVYTGDILVRSGAVGVDAFQTNRNIKLSEDAWAQSVPNLEIETNDVRCSHASAIGPVDPEQRFYLESRGVPPGEAERLIVMGFFEDLLARVGEPSVVEEVRSSIARRLAGSPGPQKAKDDR